MRTWAFFLTAGHRRGRSVLMEDNVPSWLIANSTSASASSSRRHIELALCHLGQNGMLLFYFKFHGSSDKKKKNSGIICINLSQTCGFSDRMKLVIGTILHGLLRLGT